MTRQRCCRSCGQLIPLKRAEDDPTLNAVAEPANGDRLPTQMLAEAIAVRLGLRLRTTKSTGKWLKSLGLELRVARPFTPSKNNPVTCLMNWRLRAL